MTDKITDNNSSDEVTELRKEIAIIRENSKLQQIEGELGEIRRTTQNIRRNENLVGIAVTLIIGVIAILTGYFNLSNSERIEKANERFERRLDQLSGISRPKTASVSGIWGKDDKTITMQAEIRPEKVGDNTIFTVHLRGMVDVRIKGANGQVLGYRTRTSGELSNFSAHRIDGSLSRYILKYSETGSVSLDGTSTGGLVISENAPLRVTITRVAAFLTCENAQSTIDNLISLKDGVGTVGLIPLFNYIEEPVSEFTDFQATVVLGDYIPCNYYNQP